MMTTKDVQMNLKAAGFDPGPIDGLPGPKTDAAVMAMFEDGPDTPLSDIDIRAAADRLGVSMAHIRAVIQVEANGSGFEAGKPKILPEPHRFSKLTGGRFDNSHPALSYKVWRTRPYPKTQALRYAQLLGMIRLDPNAGFAAASYGKFQIMGENHKACGFVSAMAFAQAMARDEAKQLMAFEAFLKSTGLLAKLRAAGMTAKSWEPFAAGYNGTGYRANSYHIKLAAAYKAFGGS